ncbi:TonB-dependent receptor [Labilibaculum sp. A4]|uniref:TonB-dependent receptor plug domain-containing protein n=1 Tax=Labilibaculum euxinus TaxID=2686357 RepID=UPI000F6215CB|nr:TonB-dependent receptor plug domain-containing protein [Labilibaculum euxinus]MDQ1771893.1 TonB-dependent receptor [Labilibaculum euxinus]MWN77798.1 TonB-dependent receptor [Labilibaculum euxinus]
MKLKFLFTVIVSFLSFGVWSQTLGVDTIQIESIDIVAPRLQHFSSTEKTVQIDSILIQRYDGKDLSSLLQKTSLVNISSNGAFGALATAGMRGASGTHTSVNWNGIPVNSLTTGSADLSLINAGSFDQVQVIYGAVGSLYGSGTLGGAIELSNKPDWKKKSEIGLSSEIGSFSNYKTKLHSKYSNSWISYTAQAFFQYGKNDFTYTDKYDFDSPTERLTNNENRAYGTIHDLHLKLNNHFIDLGAWYQAKKKNIAGLMGIGKPFSHQQQRDSSLKVYLGWKTLVGKFRVEAKTAYLYDYLKYTDGYTSEISSERVLNDANLRYYLNSKFSLDVNGKYSWLKGETNNYEKEENESRLTVAGKYSPNFGTFIFTFGREWSSEVNPPEMYSFSSLLHIISNVIDLRVKAGTHYRRPTFNERYWQPGGNENIKSEEGWSADLGLAFLSYSTNYGEFNADLSLYHSKNKNAISWRPTGSFWSPQNTGQMISRGVELELNHILNVGSDRIHTSLKYAYNDAYNNDKFSDDYKQTMAYRPHHITKILSDLIHEKWDAGIIATFRSHSQNWEEQEVEGNFLLDVNAGYLFETGLAKIKLTGRIENLLDKSYELVKYYPMPGRAYYLGLNVIF